MLFQFNKMNRDMTKMRQRIFEITNFVNMVYRPLRTFIALVGLEVWSTNDLISVTNPAGANLNAFMKWRKSNLAERIKHDNAHLIRSDEAPLVHAVPVDIMDAVTSVTNGMD
ncbi:PREDICTED: snake venom metalloproteinase fibrolase-like [Cyprinodon variegatus]|uniref:snake venom metalloproteinase fibrolase-like n=1 Tax=Cyprinodon variegatus TaxID=28743 RepID=UPI000742A824|nr:PREDICTED: snake venom metalloproteinase fibrolase-like [Cyprinodon variegatus]